MAKFEDYVNKYKHVRMERRNGILQIAFHTNGEPLKWGPGPHEELGACFNDIGSDPENKAIIMTGTGDKFNAEFGRGGFGKITPRLWDHLYRDAKRLLMNLLDIEVPMIAAVNGPAIIHAELAALCDIVLATEQAVFQDAPHFANGLVPGDGVHVMWPLVLGINRGCYFLLTGQKLSAQEALNWGVVNEVLPREQLLPRAWELAEQLIKRV
jgi:enoyl-CoA hydratase/carnithine racemase